MRSLGFINRIPRISNHCFRTSNIAIHRRLPSPAILPLASHHHHHDTMSSPPPSDRGSDMSEEDEEFQEPTPETNIRDCGYSKCGSVIYRTTYNPSSTPKWDQFKALVLSNLRNKITHSLAPEILNNMDFIFADDPSLDNISIANLQRRFQSWVESENMLPFKPSQADPAQMVYVPRGARYEFFVMVDELALLSPCVELVRGFPEHENPHEVGREHVKVWHIAVGTELYDELGDPNAPYTGRYYNSLPGHLVAQGY
ncbi:hypothetical protein CGRA01v4_00061 [Colletotrichum graminicola]|nr:hypothetical protein CGRA01v4_00061 [Colletotrichum graminicola]